jgi:hypothetical protein
MLKTPPEHNSWQLFIRLSLGKVPKKIARLKKKSLARLATEYSVALSCNSSAKSEAQTLREEL